jgi:sugar phosphate isomerase/epimerase
MNNSKRPLAIQLYTIRDAVEENLEKSLERLAGLGFKQLEIYGYDGKFFGKTRKEFSPF